MCAPSVITAYVTNKSALRVKHSSDAKAGVAFPPKQTSACRTTATTLSYVLAVDVGKGLAVFCTVEHARQTFRSLSIPLPRPAPSAHGRQRSDCAPSTVL